MQCDEFLKHVQSLAQLSSCQEAERATRATLETLCEHITSDEAENLALQLPPEIGEYLCGKAGQRSQDFSLQTFYQRVSNKEGTNLTVAATHAKAVLAVLNAAAALFFILNTTVALDDLTDIQASLPQNYEELFLATMSSSETPTK